MQQSDKNLNREYVLSKLKKVLLFSMYADNDDVIKKIAGMCTQKNFRKGSTIIKEGDYGDDLYIFLKGRVEVVKNTMQNDSYTVATFNADQGGVYVGEQALIDSDRRSASVIARSECECLVLKRETFEKFGNENPEIGLNITRVIASQLSSRLRKTNTDVITLFSALVEEIGGGE